MRLRLIPALLIALLALAAGVVSACGGSDDGPILEGQALELGEVNYYVQLTRFLNPASAEDAAYLENVAPIADNEDYLAVFLRASNESDQEQTLATDYSIVDTRGNTFQPLPVDTPFSLQPGATIPAGEEYPPVDSPARSGPVKGSYLLFALPVTSQENRPLDLEITDDQGNKGQIELDL